MAQHPEEKAGPQQPVEGWTDANEQLAYLAKELCWEPGQIDDPRIGDELRPVDLALRLIQEYGTKALVAERLAEALGGWALPALEEATDFLTAHSDGPYGTAHWRSELRNAVSQARAALEAYSGDSS